MDAFQPIPLTIVAGDLQNQSPDDVGAPAWTIFLTPEHL